MSSSVGASRSAPIRVTLVGGGPHVTGMDNWMRFTDYCGFKKTDRVIEWFWACLCSWPAERKLRLLQFMTGTSHIPVNDFKDLQRQRRPAPLHNQEEWQPESPPTQPHALESLRYAAVRGI